jgi:hypothetical protein
MFRRDLVDFGGPNIRLDPQALDRSAHRRIPPPRSTSSHERVNSSPRLRPTATPTANSADSRCSLAAARNVAPSSSDHGLTSS